MPRMKDDERCYLGAIQMGRTPDEALAERDGDPGRLRNILRGWQRRGWYTWQGSDSLVGSLTHAGIAIDCGAVYVLPEQSVEEPHEYTWPPNVGI